MNRKLLALTLLTLGFLIGVLIFYIFTFHNSDKSDDSFYDTGINLTFENRNSEFDAIETTTYKVCNMKI